MAGPDNPVLIIDIELGNTKSVSNAFKRIGEVTHTSVEAPAISAIDECALVVLPGVGAFDRGIQSLRERGWAEWLAAAAVNQTPILGLCLGMQLLCQGSAEGSQNGLGILPGRFERFEFSEKGKHRLKVPHMGWNYVRFDHRRAPWSGDPAQPQRFYFVHSFYLPTTGEEVEVGWSQYGGAFTSAIATERVIGLQFHPEKSHRFGTELLRGIVNWARA